MSDQPPPLAKAIRQARMRASLSQAELAERLQIRQSSVSQWERGSTRPSTEHLLALAATLGIDILHQLTSSADPEHPNPTSQPTTPDDQPATDQHPH